MFDYEHKPANEITHTPQKETIPDTGNTIHICQKQDVRITRRTLSPSRNTIQKKGTAEYLNPVGLNEARHHIIPDNVLRQFISRLRENDNTTFLRLVNAVEESYIQYHGVTPEEISNAQQQFTDTTHVREYIRGFENRIRANFLVLITYTKTNDHDEYLNEMQAAFVWSPGNLVIGPRNRTADPGDAYDREAAKIAGIPLGTPRILEPGVEPTGQMALGEVLSMMLYYIDGTIDHVDQNIINTMLIPHIKRGIFDGRGGAWL